MTIPIQAPQIRPDIAQRTPSGEGEGLSPLIAALTRYKQSKLEEQRNAIEATRAQSEAGLQGVQAEAIRAKMARDQAEDEAWDKQIAGAPQVLQPFLRATSAARVLPPELQHVVGAALAQAMIPGVKPEQVTQMQGYMRLGMDTASSAKLAGIPVYDIADTKTPHDPNAVGLPKNILNWKYTPPGAEARADALAFRAQTAIVNEADRDDHTIIQAVAKAKDQIAVQAWKGANPTTPAPLVPPKYDPSDPSQVMALHRLAAQNHWDTRMQLNATNRKAAKQRIDARGLGVSSDALPTADRIQQILNLMQQPADTTPQ